MRRSFLRRNSYLLGEKWLTKVVARYTVFLLSTDVPTPAVSCTGDVRFAMRVDDMDYLDTFRKPLNWGFFMPAFG